MKSLPHVELVRSPQAHGVANDVVLHEVDDLPRQGEWLIYHFIDPEQRELVGSGGFKGLSDRRIVEIGYQVTPAYRGRGYAKAAVRRLVERAFRSRAVEAIEAESLATENASVRVLRASGFEHIGDAHTVDGSHSWRWRLERAAASAL